MNYYRKGNISLLNRISIFLPLCLWSIIIYIKWWKQKKKWMFGKKILIPLSLPYIYGIFVFITKYNQRIPFEPNWKLCFNTQLTPQLKNKNIISSWNWSCGKTQTSHTLRHISSIQDKLFYISYSILLVGILSTSFKKMAIFNNSLIRSFTIIALLLTVLGNSLRWLNDYGLYSELLARLLGVNLVMACASFFIIIMGLSVGIGEY